MSSHCKEPSIRIPTPPDHRQGDTERGGPGKNSRPLHFTTNAKLAVLRSWSGGKKVRGLENDNAPFCPAGQKHQRWH